ncbi:GNAT family N-acetyltransferase [Paenibacillus tengchongensis]|uniref:GNAT family N-acetyltransferase n=1 Tax=Paenibacillus tengchongensis TaxID=2608684 RepID=UPI00124CAD7B|nr:GNAT family N-acetyltransferase [Paenibacillus tengchongensis]
MSTLVFIRQMRQSDADEIFRGLSGHDIAKSMDYIQHCWQENYSQTRVTLLAFYEDQFAGWGHVVYQSQYMYFAGKGIPEIQNFDVIPPLRNRGIGSRLIEALEERALARSDAVGIGFGLYAAYGAAQRLYVKRGYIPDGRGMMYDNVPVEPGARVCVDDDLCLYLIKKR